MASSDALYPADLSKQDGAALDKQIARLASRGDDAAQVDLTVAAAYKTVDTFAGLMGRKLWLRNSQEGAYTDGWEIGAPFKHDFFYQLVEHELSHCLFRSSSAGKEKFVEEYSAQIRSAVESNGTKLPAEELAKLKYTLGMLTNILEDHRVNSLWALLYPGSYVLLQGYARTLLSAKATVASAHDNLLTFFVVCAYDVPGVPAGPLDRLRPAFIASLKKVECKGPGATFLICKWLVTQVVSELIRMLQGAPPPADAGQAQILVDLPAAQAQPKPAPPTNESKTGESPADAGGKPEDPEGGDDDAPKAWEPPSVAATSQERVSALKRLVSIAGDERNGAQSPGEQKLLTLLADVHQARFDARGASQEAHGLVKTALETNVNDTSQLDLVLARSHRAMEEVIDQIESQLRASRKRTEDEWISRDAHAKVTFRDVRQGDAPAAIRMDPEDRQTARRLKELFSRVHQRRASRLEDCGAEVDIEARIAGLVTENIGPVFKEPTSGRGFKALVLIDRSASMSGAPSVQVERATRILRSALRQPNVEFHVWGFQSALAEVILTRIPHGIDVQDSSAMPVRGETPIHVAVRTAVNWMQSGSEKKHLIVLTDGEPVFSTAAGKSYGSKNLKGMVQKECRRARRQGINVTAIGIGNGVDEESLTSMFGSRRYWTHVSQPKRLGQHLVKVMGTSFLDYLRHA